MKILLLIAGFGNIVDTIATAYLSSLGYVEANPIMAQFLAHPVVFASVKIVVMTGLLVFLWQKRTDKHAKTMAILASVVYGAIACYYAWFFNFIV